MSLPLSKIAAIRAQINRAKTRIEYEEKTRAAAWCECGITITPSHFLRSIIKRKHR